MKKKIIVINNFVIIKLFKEKKKIILSKNLSHSNMGQIISCPKGKKVRKGNIIIFDKKDVKELNFFKKKYMYLKYKKIICLIK